MELIHEWSAAQTVAQALGVAGKWLPELIWSDRASITVYTDDEEGLEVVKLVGSEAIATGTILPVEGSAAGAVSTAAKSSNIPDLAETEYLDGKQLVEFGLHSALLAPMVSAGTCFGTLNVARAAPGAFDAKDEILLSSVAEVLGSILLSLRRIEVERIHGRTDALTSLANRRHILDLLDQRLSESSHSTHILFIDLDGFKLINDAYGHGTGDAMLREIARRLVHECGRDHTVGRIGGDEFLIVCGEGTDLVEAQSLAQRLIRVGSQQLTAGPVALHPRLSIGLAVQEDFKMTVAEMLAHADRAMYEAKRTGVGVVEVDENLRHHADLLAAIDQDLDAAIENDQIDFYYQPIRKLRSNEILGCEALMRWFHPEVGLVPPPLLIERSEATNRIDALTRWGLDRVARDWAGFRRQHPRFHDKAVAYNLSPRQLGWSGYCELHMSTLQAYDLRPADIVVEVVESGEIEVETTAERTIRTLAANGVVVALDDFGRGHNVIGYFSRFPIHAIKIDRSMVAAMVDNAAVRVIVKGLAQIARELGISALGEGIETQAEFEACVEVGVPDGQGYLLGRPMPLADLHELVLAEQAAGPSDSPSTDRARPRTGPSLRRPPRPFLESAG